MVQKVKISIFPIKKNLLLFLQRTLKISLYFQDIRKQSLRSPSFLKPNKNAKDTVGYLNDDFKNHI